MVRLEIADLIARITINDIAALSRHDATAGTALLEALRTCDDRDDVKAIVLATEGADFCAPATAGGARGDEIAWAQIFAGAAGLYQLLCYSKKITITAVQGRCADAGTALVLCSDLTVAAADAQFLSPFVRLPEANFVLAALTMRLGRVKSWMLGGMPLDAPSALEAGLINRIAADAVLPAAMEMAHVAVGMPLDGIAMCKLMLESCMDAQGVGQDFDMAEFYRTALPSQVSA